MASSRATAASEPSSAAAATVSAPLASVVPALASVAAPAPAFKCSECERSFADAIALRQHITYKHSTQMRAVIEQKSTAAATTTPAASAAATASVSAASTKCQVCGIVFDSAQALAEHETDLKPIQPVSFPCKQCERVFANPKAVMQHMLLAHTAPIKSA